MNVEGNSRLSNFAKQLEMRLVYVLCRVFSLRFNSLLNTTNHTRGHLYIDFRYIIIFDISVLAWDSSPPGQCPLSSLLATQTSDLSTARPKWRLDRTALSGHLLYLFVNHACANRYHHHLVR